MDTVRADPADERELEIRQPAVHGPFRDVARTKLWVDGRQHCGQLVERGAAGLDTRHAVLPRLPRFARAARHASACAVRYGHRKEGSTWSATHSGDTSRSPTV